ncbi:TPA: conjugal transfer protein, partial [Escherichia coli]|nr:conjugal transfer protein [Escherichia coli]
KRIVNIHTLPQIMSKWSPAIVPVLAESRSPDLLMNDDGPERRWAEKPEEFAARHGLITSRMLDREKARDVFISQLGTRLSASPDTLQDYEKALFAVFGLQVLMNNRKAAKKLLDDLNRSCLPRNRKERKRTKNLYRPDFSLAEKTFQKVWQAEGMQEIHATHQYVRTALSDLLGHDIRLPPSQ